MRTEQSDARQFIQSRGHQRRRFNISTTGESLVFYQDSLAEIGERVFASTRIQFSDIPVPSEVDINGQFVSPTSRYYADYSPGDAYSLRRISISPPGAFDNGLYTDVSGLLIPLNIFKAPDAAESSRTWAKQNAQWHFGHIEQTNYLIHETVPDFATDLPEGWWHARRTRFRLNFPASGWSARGTLVETVNFPNSFPPYRSTWTSSGSVLFLGSMDVSPYEWHETPFFGDFEEKVPNTFFFTVLHETPAAWEARTGITIIYP